MLSPGAEDGCADAEMLTSAGSTLKGLEAAASLQGIDPTAGEHFEKTAVTSATGDTEREACAPISLAGGVSGTAGSTTEAASAEIVRGDNQGDPSSIESQATSKTPREDLLLAPMIAPSVASPAALQSALHPAGSLRSLGASLFSNASASSRSLKPNGSMATSSVGRASRLQATPSGMRQPEFNARIALPSASQSLLSSSSLLPSRKERGGAVRLPNTHTIRLPHGGGPAVAEWRASVAGLADQMCEVHAVQQAQLHRVAQLARRPRCVRHLLGDTSVLFGAPLTLSFPPLI